MIRFLKFALLEETCGIPQGLMGIAAVGRGSEQN
jgi:hypothetical protein